MATVKDVSDVFAGIATAHAEVQTFYQHSFDELDINKIPPNGYPLMYAQITRTEISSQKISYDYDLVVADIVFEETQEFMNTTLSNTMLIMTDILAQFQLAISNQNTVTPTNWTVDFPVSCDPFQFRFQNSLAGWSASITINVPLPLNLCEALIDV